MREQVAARQEKLKGMAKPTANDVLPLCDRKTLDLVASFQRAVIELLAKKTMRAAKECGARLVTMSGGVSCNRRLRERFETACAANRLELLLAEPGLCTDNAGMIAHVASHMLAAGVHSSLTAEINPNLALAVVSTAVAVAGLSLGWVIFRLRRVNIDLARSPLEWLYRAMERRFYFDNLYYATVVRPVSGPIARAAYWTNQKILDGVINLAGLAAVGLGKAFYYRVDQEVIDGAVNGLATGTEAAGSELRFWQSGNVQLYAASLFVGIAVLVGVFLLRG